jgi:hypothetical protein
MGGQELAGHAGAQLALLGVSRVGVGLSQGLAVGAAVHVDVLHADQPGAGGLGGGEDAGLQAGEQLHPLVVGRVEGLVDDLGALGGGGEGRVAGVAAEDLDVVGGRRGAGAVDQPYGLAPAAQGVQGGQADGAGPEDHVPWRDAHAGFAHGVAWTGAAAAVGRRTGARSTATPKAITHRAHSELPMKPARSNTGNPGTAVARMSPWLNR